jgi:hypothetical protein
MPSYLALIPLVFYRYRFPKKFNGGKTEMAEYLLRALATGTFGGSPDNLIDRLVRGIQDRADSELPEICSIIRGAGRNLEITPGVILQQQYGSRSIHLFFNSLVPPVRLLTSKDANGPQIDHIFPQSLLKKVRAVNPESGKRNLMRYRMEERDQLPNCMLLTAEENGFAANVIRRRTSGSPWKDSKRRKRRPNI